MLRLGVVVTILTLAVDPFSQQLVQLQENMQYVKDLNGVKATSPFATNYTLGQLESTEDIESAKQNGRPAEIVAAQPHFSMEVAILSGLSRPVERMNRESPSQCPSGNCTWSPFDTLAVCNQCNEVTSRLSRVDNLTAFFDHVESEGIFGSGIWLGSNSTAFFLPNGHFLPNFHGCFHVKGYNEETKDPMCPVHVVAGGTPTFLMTSYGTGNPNKTVSMHELDTLIWSMSFIQMNEFPEGTPKQEIKDIDHHIHGQTRKKGPWDDWPNTPISATECALYWCVKSLEPRVEDNIFREAGVETKGFKRKPGSWGVVGGDSVAPENRPTDLKSLEFGNRTSHLLRQDLALYFPDRPEDQDLYNITCDAVWGINAFFQESLRNVWDADGKAEKLVRAEYMPDAAVMFNGWAEMERISPSLLGAFWDRPSTNLSARFDALATSMTNEVRSVVIPAERPDLMEGEYFSPTVRETVEGRIGVQTVYYRVEWYWIALHGVILLGGIVFWASTSMEAGQQTVPVWKNHSLAAVSQGTHLAVADLIRDAKTTKDMESVARRGAVKLAVPEKTPLLDSSDGNVDDDGEPPERRRTE